MSQHSENIFPIKIPEYLINKNIADLNIPTRLEFQFQDHRIKKLGQLNGMTADDFLAWRGFGNQLLNHLILMVLSIPKIEHVNPNRINLLHLRRKPSIDLSESVFEFPFKHLSLPVALKTDLLNNLDIDTVSDFVQECINGKLSTLSIRDIIAIWQEVILLIENGCVCYTKDISVEPDDFLELIERLRYSLNDREKYVFDHRIFPYRNELESLEEVGEQFNLTRERVRQIEKKTIKNIRLGKHRKYYWLVRRKILDTFQADSDFLKYDELFETDFFSCFSNNGD
ncbi:hypothetical protein KJ564_12115, partial [bacterium]|nr:hypothetical protein [bacterium]